MIDTKVWGKHGWIFLHLVSLDYPLNPSNNDKKNYKKFFENIGFILPCKTCSNNYKKHLQEHPLNDKIFDSRESLVNWLIDIHNCVNKITNKQIYNYDEAKKCLIEIKNKNKCIKPTTIYKSNDNINLVLILILIICIIIIIHLYKNNIEQKI